MSRPAGLTQAERLAIAEAELAAVKEAIGEIKSAVVKISDAMQRMAVLDGQLLTVIDGHKELRRSLEAERDNRVRADDALSGRVSALESSGGLNSWRLDTLGLWSLRIGSGVILTGFGYIIALMVG